MAVTRIYRSTDINAPALTPATVGSLNAVLSACLVDGFTPVSVTSITRSGSIVTVTISGSHGYKKYTKITIAGATETAYNGEWSITPVSASVFTFDIGAATPTTPATGTITATQVGAGWTKPYNASNIAVFLQPAGYTGLYLQVDDSIVTTSYAKVRGYESMSSATVGTNPFPTLIQHPNGQTIFKGVTTARPWMIVVSGGTIHLFIDTQSTSNTKWYNYFGDINTYKTGDAFHYAVIAGPEATPGTNPTFSSNNMAAIAISLTSPQNYHYIARSQNQSVGAVTLGKHTDAAKAGQSTWGGGQMPYPHSPDGGLYVSPVWVSETNSMVRGSLKGTWASCHASSNFTDGDTIVGTGDMAGKVFEVINFYSSGQALLEISDNW
jgi:hypothetical protein